MVKDEGPEGCSLFNMTRADCRCKCSNWNCLTKKLIIIIIEAKEMLDENN